MEVYCHTLSCTEFPIMLKKDENSPILLIDFHESVTLVT
jgi:hypothetical protein